MTTSPLAPSALLKLTHPVAYLGETRGSAPFPVSGGVLYNLSGLPVLVRRGA